MRKKPLYFLSLLSTFAFITLHSQIALGRPTEPTFIAPIPESHSPHQDQLLWSTWKLHIYSVLSKMFPMTASKDSVCKDEQSSALERLVRQANSTFSGHSVLDYPIEVIILEQQQPNAYITRNQNENVRLFLTHGLLNVLQTESELAFVLAHEIAHLQNDHFSPHIPSLILSPEQLIHISLVHENWEFIADRQALETLQAANYHPEASIALLERLARMVPHLAPESFTHHHPAIQNRITAAKSHLGLGTIQASTIETSKPRKTLQL